MNAASGTTTGLLGDTSHRDYARKLTLFNAFARPEISSLMESLSLRPGMLVLDAGCGTGDAMAWFAQRVGAQSLVVGLDLAATHARVAHQGTPALSVLQSDIARPPLRAGSFDLVWCANTIHHLQDPLAALHALRSLLKPSGRLALLQSSLLADMCLAWDAHLEQAVNAAVRRHYQQRYAIPAHRLTGVRALLGLAHRAQLRDVAVRTVLIERCAPLSTADRDYFTEVLFRGTWDQRLQPYMSADDYAALQSLCDPRSGAFMLDRPDFHFLQSLTMLTGSA